MSSFISPFKGWIAAAVAILLIEATVNFSLHPSTFDRNNFLQFSFAHEELLQRLFMNHKLSSFADSEPTIVQSGDSSGFYGIQPTEIMRYLPEGVKYLNLSCCANLGFSGYYNIFQYMAERDKKLRYLVLYITPWTMPNPSLWNADGAALWGDPDLKVFGDAIYREFMSPQAHLYPPSLAFRRDVSDRVFYLNGLFNELDRPLAHNDSYYEFLRLYKSTLGWTPESDIRNGVPTSDCPIDEAEFFDLHRMRWKTYTEEVFDAFADLARRFDKTLVIVFQSVACTEGPGNAKTRAAIDRFKVEHPEVEMPFPLITTWPESLFSVPAHIVREHTELLTQRLGPVMAEIVKRHGY